MGWLEGQTAIVTGGASGLGRAVVDRFVQEGARVVVLDRSAEHIDKLRADHDRRTVVAVKGDVTSPAANQKAVAAAVKAFGQLDVFVGNALRGPKCLGFDRVSLGGIPGIDDLVKMVTPLGFLPAAEDYAGLYVLLASRENSRTVTGSILRGDGGIGVRGLTQARGGDD